MTVMLVESASMGKMPIPFEGHRGKSLMVIRLIDLERGGVRDVAAVVRVADEADAAEPYAPIDNDNVWSVMVLA